ncbi:ABC transporter ATP-binding protein [Streptomyces asiaticus]
MSHGDTPSGTPAVEVHELCRAFQPARVRGGRPVSVLRDMELVIPRGEVHGLLGPNGAGKTTLCKILSTILLPSSGTVRICGHDVVAEPRRVRELIGIVFGGDKGLYGRISARQNLWLWGALHGVSGGELRLRVDALLDRVGLSDRRDDRVDGFSRGMKQRLHLARGLMGDPEVLILDEPTTGMDPVAARDFRRLVDELRGESKTALITTHDMAEAEAVCDRVTLIGQGTVLATDSPAALVRSLPTHRQVRAEDVTPRTAHLVERLPGVLRVELDAHGTLVASVEAEAAAGVLRLLIDSRASRIGATVPGLEDAYLHLVQNRGMVVRR